jgi:hypothetical protein
MKPVMSFNKSKECHKVISETKKKVEKKSIIKIGRKKCFPEELEHLAMR